MCVRYSLPPPMCLSPVPPLPPPSPEYPAQSLGARDGGRPRWALATSVSRRSGDPAPEAAPALSPPAVADIPGIVRGAHRSRGLGSSFLRHIERCRCLLFVVDLSEPEPWTQLDDLKWELEKHEAGLSQRPHVVVANKIDLPEARAAVAQLRARLGPGTIALSAATGENVEALLMRLRELHGQHVAARG